MSTTQRHCKHCKRLTSAQRPETNHILHLILSVLTCGLWLPLWILVALSPGNWRCTTCGGIC